MAIIDYNESAISEAVNVLNRGNVVVFPTETVYGLGADATNDVAVAKIYEVKNRPTFNPLIAHFYDINHVLHYVDLPQALIPLASKFWAGALTLIGRRKNSQGISLLASAGLDTIGVRVPSHPIARDLIKNFGKPIVAPSANLSCGISPTTAQDALLALERQDILTIDGGRCDSGVESTILEYINGGVRILRAGPITKEEISQIMPIKHFSSSDLTHITASGQMNRHYAPNSRIKLNVTSLEEGEVLIAFGNDEHILSHGQCRAISYNLSPTGDLREAAGNLFIMLRQVDKLKPRAIAIMPIPEVGVGVAINDRLRRAAHR